MFPRSRTLPYVFSLALLSACGDDVATGDSSAGNASATGNTPQVDPPPVSTASVTPTGLSNNAGGSVTPGAAQPPATPPVATNRRNDERSDGLPDALDIPVGARVIHVSPSGDDAHDGATATRAGSSGPIRTLARARQLVRESTGNWPSGGIVVLMAPGRYQMLEPLRLDAGDSGRPGAPVRYLGTTIDGERATRVVGSVRLADAARSAVSGHPGLVRLSTGATLGMRSAVIVGHTALTEARWPNEGFSTITGATAGTVRLDGNAPAVPSGTPVTLHGFAHEDWLFELLAARGSGSVGAVQLNDASRSVRVGARAFVSGAAAYLDLPGEYVVEPGSGSVIVQSGVADDASIEVSVAATLVSANGTRHVSFEGLSLCNTTGTALDLRNVEAVVLDNVEICNTGGWAVNKVGSRSGLRDSHLRRLGGGGVNLYGGDRASLTRGDMFVEGSVIEDFGRIERSYSPAVRTEGVGGVVKGNIVRHSAHVGIMFGGNDMEIALNDISDVVREAGDMGAIYIGRNWTTQGHVIRGNRIYDIKGPGHGAARGIYLDDQFSSALIENNLFANVRNGVFVGGGRYNTVRRNVFFASDPSIHFDARGLDSPQLIAGNRPTLEATLAAQPYTSALWASRYPALARIQSENPMAPIGNRIHDNVFVDGTPLLLYGPSAAAYLSPLVGQSVRTVAGASSWQGTPTQSWFATLSGQVAEADSLFPWAEFETARQRAERAIR